MLTIGIDPGLTGAVAALDGGLLVGVWDMPVRQRTSGKGREVDSERLWSMLCELGESNLDIDQCWIEAVHAFPGQGATSTFSLGVSYGITLAIARTCPHLSVHEVAPVRWKRAVGIPAGSKKNAAASVALALYPEAEHFLQRKKDHGRADAILIAHYGSEQA